MSSTLEKTEKKIKETDHNLNVARDEKIHLTGNIQTKEEQLKHNEHNFGPKASNLVIVGSR
jgi:hypothetical protein